MTRGITDQGIWEDAVNPKLAWNEYCDKNRSSISEIWNIVWDMGDSNVPFTIVDWLILFAMLEAVIILVLFYFSVEGV